MTTKKTLSSKSSKVAEKKVAKKTAPAVKPTAKAKPAAAKATKLVAAKTKAIAKATPAVKEKAKIAAKSAVAKEKPKAKPVPPVATKPVAKEKTKPKLKAAPPVATKPTAKEKAKSKATPTVAAKTTSKSSAKPIAKEKASSKPAKVEKKDKKSSTKSTNSTYKKTSLSNTSKISGIEKTNVFIPLKPSVPKMTSPKKEAPIKEVKIPKITVKESIPYNPGYTPLEKRINLSTGAETFTKYSDNELLEFKELILKKLTAAKKELTYFQGLITRKDEQGGGTDEGRYLTMDDGSISMEREQLSQMASRAITYTDHLEKALLRIENKTYGICRVTGKLIDKARLRAVPHATLSYEAKQGLVKPVVTND